MNLNDYKRNLPLECFNAFYHILVTEYGEMFDPYSGDCLTLRNDQTIVLRAGGREQTFSTSRYLDVKDPGAEIRSDLDKFKNHE